MSRFILSVLLIVLISFSAAAPAGAAVGAKAVYKLGLVLGDSKDKRVDADVLSLATNAFVQSRRFKMVERSQLNAILTEKSLQGFLGKGNKKLSDLLGLDFVGIVGYTIEQEQSGTVSRNVVTLDVRLADVKTGEIVATVTSDRDSLTPPTSIRNASRLLFQSVREAFPPYGYVIKTTGESVVVDLGTTAGLKKNDILEIVREGEEIIHPQTGEVLPAEWIVVGELKVASSSPRLSHCKPRKGEAPLKSIVRLKAKNGKWRGVLGKIRDNAGVIFKR
ncbi:MAG TPA: CsgG/HfaB family protein [Thermoanaerobaculia bacterium]|nr:CsgG/HfaB family protein [Thermoanaerobaculia bacterium]